MDQNKKSKTTVINQNNNNNNTNNQIDFSDTQKVVQFTIYIK